MTLRLRGGLSARSVFFFSIILTALFSTINSSSSFAATDFQVSSFETDPDVVAAGGAFDFTARLVNNGPDGATNATAQISLPVGLDYVSTVSGATCSYASGTRIISCNMGTLGDGAVRDIIVRLLASVPGETTKDISVTIASDTTDSNPGNNNQVVGLTIVKGDDLTPGIAAAPDPVTAGSNVTYTLSVDNLGLNDADGARFTFNLPPGIDYISGGGNGWSCSAAGQVVTCTTTDIITALNGNTSFTIVGKITGGSGSGTYTASGSVESTITVDVNGNNDATTHDLSVEPGTDLAVSKSVSDNPMRGGTNSDFTITVSNLGPITAHNLVLTDVLPADFTFVSANGGPNWSCGNVGQTVTCTRTSLDVGSSNVVITVTAPDNASIPELGTTIINSASISSDTTDANSANDTDSVSFSLQRNGADLSISMSRSPQPVAQNSDITNTLTVRNNGPLVATGNIRATYLLATDGGGGSIETYQSFSGSGWSLVSNTGGLLTFERAGSLGISANAPGLQVVTTATGTGSLESRACTSSGTDAGTHTGAEPVEGDPIRSNNCVATNISSTAAIADLVVAKTAALDPQTTTDATQTYTLTVRNDGPDMAGNVRLSDTISNWVAAYDDRPATTVTATPSAGSCSVSNAYVNCDLGDILVGAGNAVTVTIDVTRPVDEGPAINNTASAYSLATGDNNRSNNVASVTTEVQAVTDLKLRSGVWSPNPVRAGVEATYVITFRNSGPSQASAVALESIFGGDFTYISATPSGGGSCAPGLVDNGNGTHTLNCSGWNLASQEQQIVTVRLRPNFQAAPADPRILTNSSTVSTTTHETNLANNAGGSDLTVIAAAIDLFVQETDEDDPVSYTPAPVGTDNRIVYRVDVTNRGPSYATNVTFTDNFTPVNGHRLRFICDMATAAGDCSQGDPGQICDSQGETATAPASGDAQCSVGDMAVDATYTRYLVYEVLDQPAPGGETVHKQVIVTANEPEILADNNDAEEQTTVRVRADLAMSCGAVPASVSLREPFTYELTVTNNGPGDSQITTLTPSLPAGMQLTGQPLVAGGSGTECSGASGSTSFSCDLGNVASAGNKVITVPARFVSYPSGGTYTHSAGVVTNEIDPVSGNNSCTSASGNVTRASISGYVYEDHNDDGDMDGGEAPIQNVTVRIEGTDAYGGAVDYTTTANASGFYRFFDRSPSDGSGYRLTQTHPTGYADGQENAGGSTVVGGSHATDIISAIALAAGEDKTHYDFGELPADLEVVSKAPSLAEVSIYEPFSYTIEVTNHGPASAPNSSLSDSLPVNMNLIPATPPTSSVGTCTVAGDARSFTCALGDIAAAASATVTVPVVVTSQGIHTNTASISTDRTEITLSNNSNSGNVTATKSSIACLVYQDLDDDGVRDSGEPGIGGVPMRLTGTDDYGQPVDRNVTTQPDGSCLFDDLVPSTTGPGNGGGYTLIQTTQPATFGDGLENNSAAVDAGSKATDVITPIILAANTHLPTHQFGELPVDLEVTSKVPSSATVSLLEPFDFVITVTNNGPGNATSSALTDTLPVGMELMGDAITSSAGTCTGAPDNASLTCAFGTVNNGATITVTAPVRITALPGGGSYDNTASVTTDLTETTTANNSNTGSVGVVTSSIACLVYQDLNDNGQHDGGEPGIAGVPMSLAGQDASGNTVNLTTVTGGDGSCLFDDLSPSDPAGYVLTETSQPAGFVDGRENNDGAVIAGSASTDVIGPIVLAADTDLTTHQFGELPPTGISGTVWHDVNNNAVIDGGENTLIEGVTIALTGTDSIGAVNRSTVTDANGFYHFDNLRPGTYRLTQTQPGNYLPGQAAPGTGTTTAGTADNVPVSNSFGNIISGIVLGTDQSGVAYNFGELLTASISGHVYMDVDGSGDRQVGEPGIETVTVTLTCTDYRGNGVSESTTTSADGSYIFTSLVPADNAGCTLTQTQPLSYVDASETVGTLGGTVGADVFTAIPLASNDNGLNYDFGERLTGLSGVVYYDRNNNGLLDPGEARIDDVTVTLTGTDASGVVITRIETTDGAGAYLFTGLPPSNGDGYTVTQTQPTNYLPGLATIGIGATSPGTVDNIGTSGSYGNIFTGIVVDTAAALNYNFGELREASIAGQVFSDLDRNGTRQPGEPGIAGVTITLTCTDHRGRAVSRTQETASDGSYLLEHLEPADSAGCTLTETQPDAYLDGADLVGTLGGTLANDTISTIPLTSEDAGTGYDFAELSAGLSGHVYVDTDNDGVLDSGERLLPGVPVSLTGTSADGQNVSLSTATDVNGYYLFTGLPPSNGSGYRVAETDQPAAWADGRDAAGSAGGTVGNDEVTGIVLTQTDFATGYDFGEVGGSLSGVVYTDLNNDGQQDGTESGIPGVSVALACTDVNAAPVALTTTTQEDGSYRFVDLPASDATGCAITETQPADTNDGLDRVGTLGGVLGNDVLSQIPVSPGDDGAGYDFGEILLNPATVSGHVWHDGNHDRNNNDNAPEDDWTVELVHRETPSDCTSAFSVVATQTTDSRGAYRFEGVSPGTYDIRFRSPDGGYVFAGTQSGDSTGEDIACGIGSVVVGAGDDIVDQDLPLDPNGVVYDSLTRQPVPGATVTIAGPAGFDAAAHLVGGTGNVAQTTGDDGYYQFLLYSSAPAGNYTLVIGQPDGYVPDNSSIIPVCNTVLNVTRLPTPALVQTSDTAPTLNATTHNADSCPTASAGLSGGAGSTQYYFTFNLNPSLPSANVVNNHIPLDPVTEGAFTLTKTTPRSNVSVGRLVPYTITASNNLAATLPNIEIEDQIPPGFKYKRGSASIDGVRSEPQVSGRQLTWPALTFTANQRRVIRVLLIVGSGVSEGEYVNRAWAENGFVQALVSNMATATVRIIPDPTFDCSGVIGKVFDDKNRNGYQNKGEPGLANVRLATVRGLLVTTDKHGRFHLACADVPNSDRGSNFLMKLDPRSLPSGYRLTTENPRVIRLTRGKIGKINFGVAAHRVVRLDVTRDAFNRNGDALKPAWRKGISRLVSILDQGPSILRIAYAKRPDEHAKNVRRRIKVIKNSVQRLWKRKRRRELVIETESYLSVRGGYKK